VIEFECSFTLRHVTLLNVSVQISTVDITKQWK